MSEATLTLERWIEKARKHGAVTVSAIEAHELLAAVESRERLSGKFRTALRLIANYSREHEIYTYAENILSEIPHAASKSQNPGVAKSHLEQSRDDG